VARRIPEENLLPILEAARARPEGATASQVSEALESPPPRRTLQYRLRSLVEAERLVMEGSGRWARYRAPRAVDMRAQATFGGFRASLRATVVPALTGAASRSGTMFASHARHVLPSATTGSFLIHTVRTRPSISRRTSELISARRGPPGPMNNPQAPMPKPASGKVTSISFR